MLSPSWACSVGGGGGGGPPPLCAGRRPGRGPHLIRGILLAVGRGEAFARSKASPLADLRANASPLDFGGDGASHRVGPSSLVSAERNVGDVCVGAPPCAPTRAPWSRGRPRPAARGGR